MTSSDTRWLNSVLGVLAILLAVSCPSFARSQADLPASQVKLRQAEKLADRFVIRFGQKLDFGSVYREMFVRDSVLRRRNVVTSFRGFLEDDLLKKLDDREAERAYIAFMNAFYISWLYLLNVNGLYDQADTTIYFPREIRAEIKRTALNRCRFMDRTSDCEKVRFKTRTELARFVSFSNRLSALFRKHMPRRPFASQAYRANVRQIVWNDESPYVNNGDSYLEIDESRQVYQIARGMFLFNILEERGTFRIVSLIIAN